MIRRTNRLWILAVVAASLFMLAAATGSRGLAAEPYPQLSGCWSGTWRSCTSGHQGPLFADFCPLPNGDYRVEFRGRFFRILPFRYNVVLRVVDVHGDTVTLAGSSYLGRLFGTFHYRATADGCSFHATYTSCKDRGEFCLQR